MADDIATSLPMIELGPGSTVQVDTGDPGAIIDKLTVYGTYYAPTHQPPPPTPRLTVAPEE